MDGNYFNTMKGRASPAQGVPVELKRRLSPSGGKTHSDPVRVRLRRGRRFGKQGRVLGRKGASKAACSRAQVKLKRRLSPTKGDKKGLSDPARAKLRRVRRFKSGESVDWPRRAGRAEATSQPYKS